jgi:diguanylate cyclase (GGDEF)-like protein
MALADCGALLSSMTTDGVAIYDGQGELVHWNSAAVAMTGWSASDPRARDLVHRPGGPQSIRDGRLVDLRHASHSVGKRRWDVLVISDASTVNALRDAERELTTVGAYDPLTRLPMAHLLMDHLGRAISLSGRDGRMTGLLWIRLERLVSDERTEASDEVLRQVSKRLQRAVRLSDFVARMGEHEFGVVLTAIAAPGDGALAGARLLLALAPAAFVDGRERSIGCLIGVAVSPTHAGDAESLRSAALAACDMARERDQPLVVAAAPR